MYRKLRLSTMCVLSSLCFSAFLYVRVHFPQCVFQISINLTISASPLAIAHHAYALSRAQFPTPLLFLSVTVCCMLATFHSI